MPKGKLKSVTDELNISLSPSPSLFSHVSVHHRKTPSLSQWVGIWTAPLVERHRGCLSIQGRQPSKCASLVFQGSFPVTNGMGEPSPYFLAKVSQTKSQSSLTDPFKSVSVSFSWLEVEETLRDVALLTRGDTDPLDPIHFVMPTKRLESKHWMPEVDEGNTQPNQWKPLARATVEQTSQTRCSCCLLRHLLWEIWSNRISSSWNVQFKCFFFSFVASSLLLVILWRNFLKPTCFYPLAVAHVCSLISRWSAQSDRNQNCEIVLRQFLQLTCAIPQL